ncbi:MAG TPA: hypothetical protein VI790_03015 [Candidatus Nanoarchaeia archaeon]|nr:hypothetical protein [Candidatus Nanoarchaeia archaeon]
MRELITKLKSEYEAIKAINDDELELSEAKKIGAYRKKLNDTINQLDMAIKALDFASEYANDIKNAKKNIEEEIKDLQVILETL